VDSKWIRLHEVKKEIESLKEKVEKGGTLTGEEKGRLKTLNRLMESNILDDDSTPYVVESLEGILRLRCIDVIKQIKNTIVL
jgi:hypothetical protein